MRKLAIISFCIAIVFCLSFSSSVWASDEDDVLKVAENFEKGLNTMDMDLLSSLYWNSPETTSFYPFDNPFLVQGWDQIDKDWQTWSDIPSGAIVCTFHHPQVTMLPDNSAILTVYQTSTVNPPLAEEQTVTHVRYTGVIQKIDGKWLIVHDHASFLPTE